MSDPYEPMPPTGSDATGMPGANRPVETGTNAPGATPSVGGEAAGVKDTAADAAKDVAHVAQDEGASVAREAKSQAKDLYAQTRDELSAQASQQQDRIAQGMLSMADELGSMAQQSENSGMATDLVQRASQRLDSAGSWLSAREPADVVSEVKRFARRRPGMFIAAAALAGVVAGRLTRALAQAASEEKKDTHGRPDAL